MKFAFCTGILFLNLVLVKPARGEEFASTSLLSRIAFGSCLSPDQPQLIWDAVLAARPQLFLLLADTICADSTNVTNQAAAYDRFGVQGSYQQLQKICPIWVMGHNADRGDLFSRSEVLGEYDARIFGPPRKQVQLISLDTRTFRGSLKRRAGQRLGEGPWEPNPDNSVTLLGAHQWMWLRRMLRLPAQFRIIVSDIQVVAEDHHWEKWMNLPHERKLLFDMISDTEADGVLFISGNRRQAELSMIRDGVPYPLYDLTSSPLNLRREQPVIEINGRGISDVFRDNNFGLLTIDWKMPDPALTMEIQDEKGVTRIRHQIRLSSLQAVGHGP